MIEIIFLSFCRENFFWIADLGDYFCKNSIKLTVNKYQVHDITGIQEALFLKFYFSSEFTKFSKELLHEKAKSFFKLFWDPKVVVY